MTDFPISTPEAARVRGGAHPHGCISATTSSFGGIARSG